MLIIIVIIMRFLKYNFEWTLKCDVTLSQAFAPKLFDNLGIRLGLRRLFAVCYFLL